MTLFRNKYRIESSRLKNHDYSGSGAYFITICTKHRIRYFGKIISGKMVLSEMGKIANDYLVEIPAHFPDVIPDSFVIMPDHIHAIINIKKSTGRSVAQSSSVFRPTPELKSNSLGSIINQYKRICTITIRKLGYDFNWQPRYYDHIIRSEGETDRIRRYINNNPANWERKTERR